MYCIVEIYEEYLPGDLGPMFSQEPDYSTQFETLESVKSFCDTYNEKHKNDWPKLHWHLMTEGDFKAWKEQQEYENEIYDRW